MPSTFLDCWRGSGSSAIELKDHLPDAISATNNTSRAGVCQTFLFSGHGSACRWAAIGASIAPEKWVGIGPSYGGVWTLKPYYGFEGPKGCLERLGATNLQIYVVACLGHEHTVLGVNERKQVVICCDTFAQRQAPCAFASLVWRRTGFPSTPVGLSTSFRSGRDSRPLWGAPLESNFLTFWA